MKSFEEIYQQVTLLGEKKILAVAAAEDEPVLHAVLKAKELGLCEAILVGDPEKIEALLEVLGQAKAFPIVAEKDPAEAAKVAAELVRNHKADILMKGMVDTKSLLKAVLDKERGLPSGSLISHVAAFELPDYDRLLFVTDAAMNTYPALKEKQGILSNAVAFVQSLDIPVPKVAVICAVEVVNDAMPATIDAAMLAKMNDRGQIKGCLVDGPLALDNALSVEAAEHKGIKSPVAGYADILLMPNIEAGNVLYKALTYTTASKSGGVLLGAKAPVVVTSRADHFESKVNSIAMAVLHAAKNQKEAK
ncbi:phosphate butyryltransferase [Proteiniclasticum sp. BAD-10]|uniref:Phosphate butyryltransferase n=1 Tax=Proteiniclasticum sediminis TaxID=2804028 RepID=A0A941CQC8_9CLOT|nr:phosphate butyryltransferase [Proteiniclasticum sediminis]MBR0576961.1 phosphate butyryltransferase [Proteiniclasticum sediminis]